MDGQMGWQTEGHDEANSSLCLFLSDFQKIHFRTLFRESTQISNFMKIHPVGAEFFHTDGRTDRQADGKT
jgi:hypothetical protein